MSFDTLISITQETEKNLREAQAAWRKGDMEMAAEILRQVAMDCDELRKRANRRSERFYLAASRKPPGAP